MKQLLTLLFVCMFSTACLQAVVPPGDASAEAGDDTGGGGTGGGGTGGGGTGGGGTGGGGTGGGGTGGGGTGGGGTGGGGTGPVGNADITQLSEYTSSDGEMPARDTAAYAALNVAAIAAGGSYSDPVTGLTVCKITDASTPAGGNSWGHSYSTLGAQVSQMWGGNKYTLWFINPAGGGAWLADVDLNCNTSNYRPAPATEGRAAFARTAGNEQIMYYVSRDGTRLNRYDTATDADANIGAFPITGLSISGNSDAWLHCTEFDTYCAAKTNPEGTVRMDLATGDTATTNTSLDEPHMTADGSAVILHDGSPILWDVTTNTEVPFNNGPGFSTIFHTNSHNDFFMNVNVNTNTVNGQSPRTNTTQVLFDNTTTNTVAITGFWGDYHMSAYARTMPGGPQILFGCSGNSTSDLYSNSWQDAIFWVDAFTGAKRLVGHAYQLTNSGIYPNSGDYWDQLQPHPAPDGGGILFRSNMNSAVRYDVFFVIMPRS